MSTFDLSTLYTFRTLPHNQSKLNELIEQTLNSEGSLYLDCNEKLTVFKSQQPKIFNFWSCQRVCDALHYLLDNIFIRFGSKVCT